MGVTMLGKGGNSTVLVKVLTDARRKLPHTNTHTHTTETHVCVFFYLFFISL